MKQKHTTTSIRLSDKEFQKNIASKLQLGEYLSYKELTDRLNIPYKTGKSKQLQLDNLRRFIDLEQSEERNSKYLVMEIYDNPEPKVRKLRSDAIYTKFIEVLLLTYLHEREGYTETLTKKQWWIQLQIVNSLYSAYSIKENRLKLLNETEVMDIDNIDEFFARSNKRFSTLFRRALQSLENRALITYHNVFVLRYQNDDPYDFHIANDKEEINITESIRYGLDVVGLQTKNELFFHPEKVQEYFDAVEQYQYDKYDIVGCYEEIKINSGSRFLLRELNYTLHDLQQIMKDANLAFYNNEITEIQTKFSKNQLSNVKNDNGVISATNDIDEPEKAIIMFKPKKDNDYKIIKNFVENQIALSDKLIKVGN